MLHRSVAILAAACCGAFLAVPCAAEPWFADLSAEAPDLPWVCEGVLLDVTETSTTFQVLETFRGSAMPGDTATVGYWEMGTFLWTTLSPGDTLLLVPDETGALRITGSGYGGYWSLRGFYDCNAFIVRPGAVSTEGIRLLLDGEALPPVEAAIAVRFPGSEESLHVTLRETAGGWSATSGDPRMAGIALQAWSLALGGGMRLPDEPPVSLELGAGNACVECLGRIDSLSDGAFHCTLWPAVPVLTSAEDLVSLLGGERIPGVTELPLELSGIRPEDIGLPADPSLGIDACGELVLVGADGPLPLYVVRYGEDGTRPELGFGRIGDEDRMVFLGFGDLPDGPSGHLATDIVDALSRGPVTGTVRLGETGGTGTFTIGTAR